MTASRSQAMRAPQPRRHAPSRSVSTRIVLCVFASTLLTALIVSWLSIGAIHHDARSRVRERVVTLVDERASWIDDWHAQASDQLAAFSTIGTPWHDELIRALEAPTRRDRETPLHWVPGAHPEGEPPDSRIRSFSLPTPPPALIPHLERLTLRPLSDAKLARSIPEPLGCLSARTELHRAPAQRIAVLEGCLDNAMIEELLHPPPEAASGLRVLLADDDGRIAWAAGGRSESRIGHLLPMATLGNGDHGELADYRDPDGIRLVGAIQAIGQTGWYVVVEAKHAEALAPALDIARQILIVDVFIILLFSVLAYKITLAIMQPIEALSDGARRIAAGDVDHQIPMPIHDDELGLLTMTFNDMMKKLRSNQLEIEEDRFRLAEKNEELQRANEILAQLSITDGLTKLHNHRYFQDHLTREIKRVSRTGAPLSMILLDIDDFKLLNDTHGHAAGDEVLMALAAIMNDSARESDLIARYGGEEFVILMPNTDLAGAVHLAEKLRMAVESTRLIIGESMKPIDVTISLGVAPYQGKRREFFAEADRALYQAKGNGKNCVVVAGCEAETRSLST